MPTVCRAAEIVSHDNGFRGREREAGVRVGHEGRQKDTEGETEAWEERETWEARVLCSQLPICTAARCLGTLARSTSTHCASIHISLVQVSACSRASLAAATLALCSRASANLHCSTLPRDTPTQYTVRRRSRGILQQDEACEQIQKLEVRGSMPENEENKLNLRVVLIRIFRVHPLLE